MSRLAWALGLAALLTSASASYAEDRTTDSLFALPVTLTDQAGKTRTLDIGRGHRVIVTLFYGSCPNACPLLIESIRATERALSTEARKNLRVLLISVDPDRDTPAALAKLAATRRVDLERWTLATASHDDVRLIAAALDIQYRRLPNGEFNHTSVLTLLSPDGLIEKQASALGRADAEFVAMIEKQGGRRP
jgi:protein SCO1